MNPVSNWNLNFWNFLVQTQKLKHCFEPCHKNWNLNLRNEFKNHLNRRFSDWSPWASLREFTVWIKYYEWILFRVLVIRIFVFWLKILLSIAVILKDFRVVLLQIKLSGYGIKSKYFKSYPHFSFWHSYGLEQEQLDEQNPSNDPESTGQLIWINLKKTFIKIFLFFLLPAFWIFTF